MVLLVIALIAALQMVDAVTVHLRRRVGGKYVALSENIAEKPRASANY